MFENEYKNETSIPEEVKHLFHESEKGVWSFLAAADIKTTSDVTSK